MLISADIQLLPLSETHVNPLAKLANNKKIWDNVRDIMPFPYTIENARFFINHVKDENPVVTFAIEYKNEFCGIVGLVKQLDVYRFTAEIGYWIGEEYWGKGIATEVVRMITRYGFEELKLVRIHTGVFEYNVGSMKVLEKCGYKKDGIFESAIVKNEKIWDEHRFSILNKNAKLSEA